VETELGSSRGGMWLRAVQGKRDCTDPQLLINNSKARCSWGVRITTQFNIFLENEVASGDHNTKDCGCRTQLMRRSEMARSISAEFQSNFISINLLSEKFTYSTSEDFFGWVCKELSDEADLFEISDSFNRRISWEAGGTCPASPEAGQ